MPEPAEGRSTLSPMGTDARRTYTPEQKAEALALYVEHGPAEASRRCDIPAATIRQWGKRAGKTSPRAEQAVAGAEAARKTWAQRKGEVALLAGEEAEAIRQADGRHHGRAAEGLPRAGLRPHGRQDAAA